MKITDIPEIFRLSTAEKILFVEEVWDSIASRKRIPMPESHKAELDRRLAKYQNYARGIRTRVDLKGL